MEAGHTYTPKEKLVRKKTGLPEQGASAGKKGFMTFGRWGRKCTRMSGHAERKLEREKLS